MKRTLGCLLEGLAFVFLYLLLALVIGSVIALLR